MKASNPKTLRYYQTTSGKTPFLEWLDALKDSRTRHRIRARLDRVSLGNFGDYKVLGDGVCELRLDFGPGYRVYFAEKENTFVILLCAGDKSSQKKDIDTAKRYWYDLLERSHE